jgi:hypothetical protein
MIRQAACSILFVLCLHAQAGVFMNRYDAASTGANTHERILNVANVNPAGFAKLYTYYVDGAVYAQPLYVPAVAIPARTATPSMSTGSWADRFEPRACAPVPALDAPMIRRVRFVRELRWTIPNPSRPGDIAVR